MCATASAVSGICSSRIRRTTKQSSSMSKKTTSNATSTRQRPSSKGKPLDASWKIADTIAIAILIMTIFLAIALS